MASARKTSKSELRSTLDRGVIKRYNTPLEPLVHPQQIRHLNHPSPQSIFHELTKETFSFKPFSSTPQNLPACMGNIQDLGVFLAVTGTVQGTGTVWSSFFVLFSS